MTVDFVKLPDEEPIPPGSPISKLHELPCWVGWRDELVVKNGKRTSKKTKRPYMPGGGGRLAETDNPETWGTFEQAKAMNGVDGIGFVLTGHPNLAALDCDGCRNPETGEIAPWADDLLAACDSYSEQSPSGTGIRIIGTVNDIDPIGFTVDRSNCPQVLPPGSKDAHVEVYVRHTHYVTITGNLLGDELPINDITATVQALIDEYRSRQRTEPSLNGAPADQPPPKVDLSDLSPAIAKLIAEGPGAEVKHRFPELVKAVGAMRRAGYVRARIYATLRAYRNGIADHCFKNGKDDVERKVAACLRQIDDDLAREWAKRYGNGSANSEDGNGEKTAGSERTPPAPPPVTIDEWLARDLPDPDWTSGRVFSTTNRGEIFAPTGIGKTIFAMALALRMSAGLPFLNWCGWHPTRVLYIDGEMSNRVMKRRLAAAVKQLGFRPEGFRLLSYHDLQKAGLLNTPEGQALIEWWIDYLKPNFIFFDNRMALIGGNMRETEAWDETKAWAMSLIHRSIGHTWIHHTGIDETRGYGDKTREWMLDYVIGLEALKRGDTDVSFTLKFTKAREREPETREDFAAMNVALVNGEWTHEAAQPGSKTKKKPSPMAVKYLEALTAALAIGGITTFRGKRAVTMDAWKEECITLGLIGADIPANTQRAHFYKYSAELVAGGFVACVGDLAWKL